MPRKKDTLDRRNRRFLAPLFEFTLPSMLTLIALAKLPSAICGLAVFAANRAACTFEVPSAAIYSVMTIALVGLLASSWRYYRDYICHERFDGLF